MTTVQRTEGGGSPGSRLTPWRLYARLPAGLRGWVDRVSVLRRLKHRAVDVRADRVLALLAAMANQGVEVWLSGGWGVDALAGRQTRSHHDVDLLVRSEDTESAMRCLRALGFASYVERHVPEARLSRSLVFRDGLGRHVDLHPARVLLQDEDLEAPDATIPDRFLGTGSLAGRPVPCLTAPAQIELHLGYEPRERDLHDLELLRELSRSVPA